MPIRKEFFGLNVETLVLVAVLESPFIFQGCFKITELQKDTTVLYFFRSLSSHTQQNEIINYDFSSDDYELTHLYNESGFISLETKNPVDDYVSYMLKYALHITLKEMISNQKIHQTSIDDIAMEAMINKIKPILNKKYVLPEEDYIGFSVAMDFNPKEEIGRLAALTLLNKTESGDTLH